jgi:hypothetical protein
VSIRILGLLIILVAGCASGDSGPPPIEPVTVDPGNLPQLRVFFGHQSVGGNLLDGIEAVAPQLEVVPLDTAPPTGGAFIEGRIGHNQHPATKDRAFLEALTGLGAVDLALYKYCYVDVGPETDPVALFAEYTRTLDAAPVRTVPVTLPITATEPDLKRWLKGLAGRPTQAALNTGRMQFNEMIRERYGESGIVDLARMESTREDGSRCLVELDGRQVECLAPEFTDDGAHLNERGRRVVAARFVEALRDLVTPAP